MLIGREGGDVLLCGGSHHSLNVYCLSIIDCVDTKSVPAVDSPARPSRPSVLQICFELGRLFKRTGNRNPKLIGSDNSLLYEAIPEATVSSNLTSAIRGGTSLIMVLRLRSSLSEVIRVPLVLVLPAISK